MNKVISKTIELKIPKLPPDIDLIERQLKSQGYSETIRWAIVDVVKDSCDSAIVKLSISYLEH